MACLYFVEWEEKGYQMIIYHLGGVRLIQGRAGDPPPPVFHRKVHCRGPLALPKTGRLWKGLHSYLA